MSTVDTTNNAVCFADQPTIGGLQQAAEVITREDVEKAVKDIGVACSLNAQLNRFRKGVLDGWERGDILAKIRGDFVRANQPMFASLIAAIDAALTALGSSPATTTPSVPLSSAAPTATTAHGAKIAASEQNGENQSPAAATSRRRRQLRENYGSPISAAPQAPTAPGVPTQPVVRGITRMVPIEDLVCNRDFQSRVGLNDGVVKEYAEILAAGGTLPTVEAVDIDGKLYVVDGYHRVEAAKQAKIPEIAAHVEKGSRQDAIRKAAGANIDHGLRRTSADKRRAVEMLLGDPELAKNSDRVLADIAGVSNTFVGAMRAELEAQGHAAPAQVISKHGNPVTRAKKRGGGAGSPAAIPPVEGIDSEAPGSASAGALPPTLKFFVRTAGANSDWKSVLIVGMRSEPGSTIDPAKAAAQMLKAKGAWESIDAETAAVIEREIMPTQRPVEDGAAPVSNVIPAATPSPRPARSGSRRGGVNGSRTRICQPLTDKTHETPSRARHAKRGKGGSLR